MLLYFLSPQLVKYLRVSAPFSKQLLTTPQKNRRNCNGICRRLAVSADGYEAKHLIGPGSKGVTVWVGMEDALDGGKNPAGYVPKPGEEFP